MAKTFIFFKKNWVILTILLVGGLLRVIYAFAPTSQISPDESTYGLAALHWVKGTDFPIFYYAQPYTGTLSAIISAGLMAVFGITPFWLKIVPLLCSVAFVYTNYLLGKKIFKREAVGLLAALFTALCSPFFLNWSGRAGSGYPEMILIGNLSLLLILKILYPEVREAQDPVSLRKRDRVLLVRYQNYAILGLLLGLGFWIQPSIVYYAVPVLLLLLLFKPWLFFTLPGWLLILGAVLGCSPVIYYNIVYHGATSSALFHDPWGIKNAASSFWTVGFPIIAGLRASWTTADFFKPLSILIYLFYFAAGYWLFFSLIVKFLWEGTVGWSLSIFKKSISFIFCLAHRLRSCLSKRPSLVGTDESGSGVAFGAKLVTRTSLWSQELARLIDPAWLIWGVLFFTWLIFSLSGQFGQFVIEPRYILSLYTVLPLLAAGFIIKASLVFSAIRYFLILLVLASQLIGLALGGKNTRPDTFLNQYSLKPLINFLDSRDIGFVYADEEICHRLIFESNERIICTPITDCFTTNRYPAYKEMVINADKKNLAYVRAPGRTYHTQECLSDLNLQTDPCHFEQIGEFGIYSY